MTIGFEWNQVRRAIGMPGLPPQLSLFNAADDAAKAVGSQAVGSEAAAELLRDAEQFRIAEHGGHRGAVDELLGVMAGRHGFAGDRGADAEPAGRAK